MTQWRVEINNTEFANNLYDVEVTDALNREVPARHQIRF
jgi:hypothetical protein